MKQLLRALSFLLLLLGPAGAFGQSLTFSVARGFYQSPFQLALSTSIAGGTIRYTIDGSAPSATAGTVYAGPIAVNTTTVVRALAYGGAATTAVTTNSYLFLSDVLHQPKNVAGWPNNVYPLGAGTATATHDYEMDPKVVNDPAYAADVKAGLTAIPTMSLVLDKADFWDLYDGDGTHPTSVEMFYPDGAKEQFNCDLEGHSHKRLKRSLKLTFGASISSNLLKKVPYNGAGVATSFKNTKIVLRSGNNRSWARNWNPDRTCYTRDEWYRVSQEAITGVGNWGTFVHLYVNGLYWGLYNPVERSDAGTLANYYGGAPADWLAFDSDGPYSGDPARYDFLTTTLVNQDMRVAANYAQLQQYVDVAKFCDYLIVTWMTGMTDWPNNNFHGAQRNTPPGPLFYNAWDCEWSWDVTNGSNNGAWVHPQFRTDAQPVDALSKIWAAARRNPEFMQLFADRVYRACFNNGGLTDAASRARWAQINNFVKTAVVDESARWGDGLQDGVTRTRDGSWAPEVARVDGLMNGNVARFVAALVAQGYYPDLGAPTFAQEGGAVAPGFALSMANPNSAGTLYYTTDGTDPRAAGTAGAVAPGALAYTGPVAIAGSVVVKARVLNGTAWSPLHEASFTVSGLITGLFINEFLASNTKYADEFGEFDDWIEIYNSGSQPVNIGGLYITDVLTNLTQWQIPTTDAALTTIPAKGHLLLWADGQPAQGPLHTSIKLSKSGEAIGLSQMIGTTPTVLDSYTFGAQTDDVSVGRLPDGGPTLRTFTAPTPGATNAINFRSNLFINEFLAVNQTSIVDEAGEHDGWIEVFNNNSTAVDVGGLYLTNALGTPALYRIPTTNAALTTIPAKGYLTLWADNQPAQGPLHLGFALNAGGGQLGLADVVGPDVSVIDSTRYGAQTANVSRGRYPDASKQFKAFAAPTPGAANTAPAITGLFINEFLASNTKYADEFGEFDDWIEIYNSGSQPVDVGGLFITDDLTVPNKYQIPTTNAALTTIPAKGFLLLWADDQAFQGPLHVGFKLSAGGEQIGLYQPTGATTATALDTQTFGAQTADVSSGRQQDGGTPFVGFAVPTPKASNGAPAPPAAPVAYYRIRSGGGPLATTLGAFAADQFFAPAPGNTYATATPVAGTPNPALYQTERYGSNGAFAYALPLPNGPYTVVLHFAETYWAGAGQRVFDVAAEGAPVLSGYDIFRKAGANAATTETFPVAVADGVLNLAFSARNPGGVDQPKVDAIEVLGPATGNAPPVASAGPNQTITLPTASATLAGSGTASPGTTVAAYAWSQVSGPNTAVFSSKTVAGPTVGGLVAGSYVFALVVTDANGAASAPNPTTLTVNPAPPAGGPQLVSFTLINADTEQPIRNLVAGDVLNLATLPTKNLNVQATTSPVAVGSVVFALSGTQVQNQTESVAPYALFGDANGNYNAWTPAVGSYSLRATPFTGASGGGTAGTPLTLAFTVTNQAAVAAAKGAAALASADAFTRPFVAYPNPTKGQFTVTLPADMQGAVDYVLLSDVGAQLAHGTRTAAPATSGLLFDFTTEMPTAGVYFLRLRANGAKVSLKLLRP